MYALESNTAVRVFEGHMDVAVKEFVWSKGDYGKPYGILLFSLFMCITMQQPQPQCLMCPKVELVPLSPEWPCLPHCSSTCIPWLVVDLIWSRWRGSLCKRHIQTMGCKCRQLCWILECSWRMASRVEIKGDGGLGSHCWVGLGMAECTCHV